MAESGYIETIAVHAGRSIDPETGAVVPPIHLATTFARDETGGFARGYSYGRTDNPNRHSLERCLADLEGGAACAAFASGCAAMSAVFQALSPGDHVIAPIHAYYGTLRVLTDVFVPWGLRVTFVDTSDLDAVERAVTADTKLILVETPSNPMLTVTDIEAVVGIARRVGALVLCDNTWATPVFQRPFDWGADLVAHSTTKYLGGHSDLTGGAVIARTESRVFDRIRLIQTTGGAVPSPFDCWLTLRSVQTLPWRMRAHAANAASVARFLGAHPRIERVLYPGRPDHPGHEIARRQMSDFGGMLSVLVRASAEDTLAIAGRTKLFAQATSLGGVESLIEHRASVEGPDTPTPGNLLRLSIGLEHPDDLIADLERALGSSAVGRG